MPRQLLLYLLIALLLLIGVAAMAPRRGNPARRRLGWLLALPAPWILAVLLGPFGLVAVTQDPARQRVMLMIQDGALVFSVALALALLWPLRGARPFAAAVGTLNVGMTLIITSAASLVIAPGS